MKNNSCAERGRTDPDTQPQVQPLWALLNIYVSAETMLSAQTPLKPCNVTWHLPL